MLFEGNEKVMAISAIQAETYALHKGLMEARRRQISDIKVLSNFAQLIQALQHRHKFSTFIMSLGTYPA